MASFEEAGKKLGQFCVACGWHNVTFEVAELDSSDEGTDVAFALFVEKKNEKSSAIKAFFGGSGLQEPQTEFCDCLVAALKNSKYDTELGGMGG